MNVCLYGCCCEAGGRSGSHGHTSESRPPPPPWRLRQRRRDRQKGARSGSGPSGVEAGHGSQVPRSVLSRERLLVFRGDAGLGGLLRLELLEAVECLGESESSPS